MKDRTSNVTTNSVAVTRPIADNNALDEEWSYVYPCKNEQGQDVADAKDVSREPSGNSSAQHDTALDQQASALATVSSADQPLSVGDDTVTSDKDFVEVRVASPVAPPPPSPKANSCWSFIS